MSAVKIPVSCHSPAPEESARGTLLDMLFKGDWTLMGGNRAAKEFTHISCTFGMMRAAFGPALPATSRSTVVVVRAAKTGPDFAREVSEGTRYVGEKCDRKTPKSAPH